MALAVLKDWHLAEFLCGAFPNAAVSRVATDDAMVRTIRRRAVSLAVVRLSRRTARPFVDLLIGVSIKADVAAVFLVDSSEVAIECLGAHAAHPCVGIAYTTDEVRDVAALLSRRRSDAGAKPGFRSAEALEKAGDAHAFVNCDPNFLRNPRSGRLDSRRIAGFYGLTLSKVAGLLGVSPAAVSQLPDSDRHQELLGELERIAKILPFLKRGDTFVEWVRSPNPCLEGKVPLDLIFEGSAKTLAKDVQEMIAKLSDNGALGRRASVAFRAA